MLKYRIAICDDIKYEAGLLVDCIKLYADRTGIAAEPEYYSSGEALLKAMESENRLFDMVFLDVIMGGINGIETARDLRRIDSKIPVVFLTTTRDFAVESYDVHASAYVIKPFDQQKIFGLLDSLLHREPDRRIALKSGYSYVYITLAEIRYAESQGHSLIVHTTDKDIIISEKLSVLEEQLADPRFLRCHQSYLVNMDFIRSCDEDFVLKDGTRIPVRIKEKHKMAERYYKYFVAKSLK